MASASTASATMISSRGTLKMGWQEWEWLANISQTGEEKLRRIDVEVRALDAEENDPISVLSGFLKQPD